MRPTSHALPVSHSAPDTHASLMPPSVPVGMRVHPLLGTHTNPASQLAGNDAAEALFHAASNLDPDQVKDAEVLVDRRLRRMKRDALELRRARLQEALAAAARSDSPDDPVKATALLAEKIGIERELEAIGAV